MNQVRTPRSQIPKPQGSRGTVGSPNNNLIPLQTPGPLGTGDSAQQCIDYSLDACESTCDDKWLNKPFLVGLAIDDYLTPTVRIAVVDPGLKDSEIAFGDDVKFGTGRTAPNGHSVADNEQDLKDKMRRLLSVFAAGDKTKMAERLFDKFLAKQTSRLVFEDADMSTAISEHENFLAFARLTLAAGASTTVNQKIRIHQALRNANWDINRVAAITDLGVPAFNLGSKFWRTQDFDTGLGVMINGVQTVLVYVEHYYYDCDRKSYNITLRFVLYDVFGLDDDDLDEYGASSNWGTIAGQGITAWWQLQHQFGYAPLLTRAAIRAEFKDVPAV